MNGNFFTIWIKERRNLHQTVDLGKNTEGGETLSSTENPDNSIEKTNANDINETEEQRKKVTLLAKEKSLEWRKMAESISDPVLREKALLLISTLEEEIITGETGEDGLEDFMSNLESLFENNKTQETLKNYSLRLDEMKLKFKNGLEEQKNNLIENILQKLDPSVAETKLPNKETVKEAVKKNLKYSMKNLGLLKMEEMESEALKLSRLLSDNQIENWKITADTILKNFENNYFIEPNEYFKNLYEGKSGHSADINMVREMTEYIENLNLLLSPGEVEKKMGIQDVIKDDEINYKKTRRVIRYWTATLSSGDIMKNGIQKPRVHASQVRRMEREIVTALIIDRLGYKGSQEVALRNLLKEQSVLEKRTGSQRRDYDKTLTELIDRIEGDPLLKGLIDFSYVGSVTGKEVLRLPMTRILLAKEIQQIPEIWNDPRVTPYQEGIIALSKLPEKSTWEERKGYLETYGDQYKQVNGIGNILMAFDRAKTAAGGNMEKVSQRIQQGGTFDLILKDRRHEKDEEKYYAIRLLLNSREKNEDYDEYLNLSNTSPDLNLTNAPPMEEPIDKHEQRRQFRKESREKISSAVEGGNVEMMIEILMEMEKNGFNVERERKVLNDMRPYLDAILEKFPKPVTINRYEYLFKTINDGNDLPAKSILTILRKNYDERLLPHLIRKSDYAENPQTERLREEYLEQAFDKSIKENIKVFNNLEKVDIKLKAEVVDYVADNNSQIREDKKRIIFENYLRERVSSADPVYEKVYLLVYAKENSEKPSLENMKKWAKYQRSRGVINILEINLESISDYEKQIQAEHIGVWLEEFEFTDIENKNLLEKFSYINKNPIESTEDLQKAEKLLGLLSLIPTSKAILVEEEIVKKIKEYNGQWEENVEGKRMADLYKIALAPSGNAYELENKLLALNSFMEPWGVYKKENPTSGSKEEFVNAINSEFIKTCIENGMEDLIYGKKDKDEEYLMNWLKMNDETDYYYVETIRHLNISGNKEVNNESQILKDLLQKLSSSGEITDKQYKRLSLSPSMPIDLLLGYGLKTKDNSA